MLFFTRGVSRVIFIEGGYKPAPERKMIKLLTFDNLFPSLRHSTLSRMRMAITFSATSVTLLHGLAPLDVKKILFS